MNTGVSQEMIFSVRIHIIITKTFAKSWITNYFQYKIGQQRKIKDNFLSTNQEFWAHRLLFWLLKVNPE